MRSSGRRERRVAYSTHSFTPRRRGEILRTNPLDWERASGPPSRRETPGGEPGPAWRGHNRFASSRARPPRGPRSFPGRGGPIGVVKPPRARGGCLGVVRNSGVEGCDKPGGAASQASIPGCPRNTRGTETSQYPEERKSTETPSVAASERGIAQTGRVTVRGRGPGAMRGSSRTEAVWKVAPQRVRAP